MKNFIISLPLLTLLLLFGNTSEAYNFNVDFKTNVLSIPIQKQNGLTATIATRVDKFGVARARVLPTGGSGNYSYSWSTGSTSNIIFLSCGCLQVFVTVTDNINLCSYTTSTLLCSPVACTVDDGIK